MQDNHIHFGEFEEIYYDPVEVLHIVEEKGVTEAAYSSTTSMRKEVKYREVYIEIKSAISAFSPELFKPYLWYVPSYIYEGLTVKKAFSDFPYKGIKLHPFANNWDFSEKEHEHGLHELFAFAQDSCLPVLIHTGPNIVDAPKRFELFFGKYPETKIILAHCRPVAEAIEILKKYSNVYGDTAFVPEEWIRLLIENGLGSKIITGSDFPITHYSATHYENVDAALFTLKDQYNADIDMIKKIESMLKMP